MTMLVVRNGRDTFVLQHRPNAERGSTRRVQVRADDGTGIERRGFVRPPIAKQILGRTVLSATLTGHVMDATPAQTLTIRRVSTAPGGYGKLNWNNQPSTVGPAVTSTIGALVDGDEVTWTVTELMQAIADGAPWYGFRITSNDSAEGANFYSYGSGRKITWTLTVELSDELDQPADLTPDSGSVSSGAPILSWPAPDNGGTTDQAGFQVQVDPAMNESTPAFDTGTVTSVDPQYNLATDGATAGFVAIAAAATTYWRVRVLSEGGVWSDWSDWASFTHTPKPTLTLTEPAGGSIYDPTPPIEGSVSSGTLESLRVFVLDGTDSAKIRYDSGRLDVTGATFGHVVTELYRNRRVFLDDTTYRIRVRAWEASVARAAGVVGDPTYLQVEATVVFDDDLAVEAPAAYSVTSGGSPILSHSFTRSVDPDAFVIRRNGKIYARIEAEDWSKVGTTYTWLDHGFAPGYEQSTFTVLAIVGNRASTAATDTITPTPEGVWLLTGDDQAVKLTGIGVNGFRTLDRVATYKPINLDYDVDVHYGHEGVTGSYEGHIHDDADQDLDAALVVLEQIKDEPARTVRLVWASQSRRVLLRHLTVLPDAEFLPGTRRHFVSFEFHETGVQV